MRIFRKDISLRAKKLLTLWAFLCIFFPFILYKYTDLSLFVKGQLPKGSDMPISFFILYFGLVFIHTIFTLLLNRKKILQTFLVALFFPFILLVSMAIGSSAQQHYTPEDNIATLTAIYFISTIAVFMTAKLDKYFFDS